MIVPGSASPLLLSSAGGYFLTNSLRFRSSASAYLNRTFGTPTSTTTWSLSFWLKRGNLTANAQVFSAGGDFIYFGGGTFVIKAVSGAVLETTQVFRDPSAWYHFLVVADTSNATANNRVRLYVNGTEVTAFSSRTNPSISAATIFNASSSNNIIGGTGSTEFFDGYLTEVNFIDGQALTPSSFGETSSTTGVWIPKKYTGTYGTNGFYLKFTDTTSTSTLGTDFSGNSNTWTVNNISLTAGSTYDSMNDVPTLTSATTANYATLNPLAMYGTNMLISNANLTSSATSTSNDRGWPSTIAAPNSGKWYAEFTFTSTNGDNNGGCGIMLENGTGAPGESATTVSWRDFGTLRQNASGTSYGSALVANDVVIVAYDAALGRVWFGKNGTWFASGDPATNANPSATGITTTGRFATYHYSTPAVIQANFGQRPFAYTPPTGFVRLNTFNLPTPTIGAIAAELANEYFDVLTYAGSASNQTISGLNFQPDFIWFKERTTNGIDHNIFDSARSNYGSRLISNTTNDEAASSAIVSVSSTGYTLLGGVSNTNDSSGRTYVTWNWKANGAGSSNTAGSITSTVSASTTAGFSIVTWTGNAASSATIGHGLGVAPSMIIVKNRSATWGWFVYNKFLTNPNTGRLQLNLTNGEIAGGTPGPWNNTAPTSTVFSLGDSSFPEVNGSGNLMVAYCFTPIAGYSAFGSYTGNGSTDGPFVYLGFRPRFILVKSMGASNWFLWDTARNAFNATTTPLFPNNALAEEVTLYPIDVLSNGFKLRGASGLGFNESANYIYMAFAESPFKYANAR